MEQEAPPTFKKANKAIIALGCVLIAVGLATAGVGRAAKNGLESPDAKEMIFGKCSEQLEPLSSMPDFDEAVQICVDKQEKAFSDMATFASLVLYAGLAPFGTGALLVAGQLRRRRQSAPSDTPKAP